MFADLGMQRTVLLVLGSLTVGLLLGGGGCAPSTDDDVWAAEAYSSISLPAPTTQGDGYGTATGSGAQGVPRTVGQSIDESRETAVVRAAARVSPAVVTVNVLRTQQVRDPFSDFFGGWFFSPGARDVPSLGSGFIIDASGLVLTNDHVVRGARRILVTLPDGRDAAAELLGSDPATDIAVLRIDLQGLPLAPIGGTGDLQIGEWVLAFGNPFGNLISNPEPTATVGVVSALGRHVVPSRDDRGFYLGMVQTDAAINPGNSGGPLVNALGEVIGMNTSIFSRGGGSEGVGFAIPIERVLQVAEDLVEHGSVRRAWVGLDIEPDQADEFGRTRGVRVARVTDGSPAHRSGLATGDRIVMANARRMVSPLDFEALLLDLRPGETIRIERDGGASPVEVRAEPFPELPTERVTILRDLEVVTLTPGLRDREGVVSEQGALVTGVPPELQVQIGLRPGDVIVGLNGRPVASAEELAEMLRRIPLPARVQIIFERNRGLGSTTITLGAE